MENLGILIALIAIAVAMIIGFLGTIIMILQVSNQVRVEVRGQFKELKDEIINTNKRIDNVNTKIDKVNTDLNARIDKLYDLIGDLYRELFKRDAA